MGSQELVLVIILAVGLGVYVYLAFRNQQPFNITGSTSLGPEDANARSAGRT